MIATCVLYKHNYTLVRSGFIGSILNTYESKRSGVSKQIYTAFKVAAILGPR